MKPHALKRREFLKTAATSALALAGGFQSALQATGSHANAIVIRSGSTAELTSIVAREAAASIESQPEIARALDGAPLATHELVVLWNLERKNGTQANVVVRGVTARSIALRPKLRSNTKMP